MAGPGLRGPTPPARLTGVDIWISQQRISSGKLSTVSKDFNHDGKKTSQALISEEVTSSRKIHLVRRTYQKERTRIIPSVFRAGR